MSVMPDSGILLDVDLDLEPACEGYCGAAAQLVVRFACGCPALCCTQCRNEDKAGIHLMEARGILTGADAIEWVCPLCSTEQVANFPDAYAQIVVSVVTL